MVGVPKSTGCFICRKRKIKCDETWPSCLNCHKNSKICPGPPARHTFRDLGPRLKTEAATTIARSAKSSSYECGRGLTQLGEKFADNGSVVHKFKIAYQGGVKRQVRRLSTASLSPPKSPLLRRPSPSQHHELACALVAAITTGNTGYRMSVFGPFIQEVPQRIGHNPALDAAVAVLVNVHNSLAYRKNAAEIVSPELYLRAIKTLQSCLEDPTQGMSANTLCASVLLGLVEAFAGPRQGNRYLAHVGGAGRLIELQGPDRYRASFTKEILRFSRGGIIITCIYERRPCFLASPAWRDIAFDKTGLSYDECLQTDIMQSMAELPGIFHEMKELDHNYSHDLSYSSGHNCVPGEDLLGIYAPTSLSALPCGDGYFVDNLPATEITYESPCFAQIIDDPHSILINRVRSMKASLCALGNHLNAKLVNGSTACEAPPTERNSPMLTTYHFFNWRDMTAYNCYWSVLILMNKILLRLQSPYHPATHELQAECRVIALEICKTWEDAWSNKPIGAFHTGLSFVVAYEFCPDDVKGWIVGSLNSLLDFQGIDAFRWSDEVIAMMSAKLAGDGPDLSFFHANLSDDGSAATGT